MGRLTSSIIPRLLYQHMLNTHNYCVIMAGGLGTRFWPISRKAMPKQFLEFSGKNEPSFLQMAYDRMSELVPAENIIVVTLKEFKDLVKTQLPGIPEENILLEVYNRNTAPCIAYAAKEILRRDPQAVMIATPADHVIENGDEFVSTLRLALDYAAKNRRLITIGIVPSRPDSNFGYIQVEGGSQAIKAGLPVAVKTFTEKPSKEIAEVFLQSGEFLWNSGIFVWQATLILEELGKYAPEIMCLWDESDDIDRIYTDCQRVSIDYAVMEKTDRATVIPARFKWADIGNWESLYDHLAIGDEDGNVTNSLAKHLFKEDKSNIIFTQKKGKLLAVRGMENMIVVDTEDVLMICPRDEDKIKDFLSELAMPEFEEYR